MLPIVTVNDLSQMIAKIGLERFFLELIDYLQDDFAAWNTFIKTQRMAFQFAHGVLELMPICGPDYFAFKYVNGHPENPLQNKQTVVAIGLLAEVSTGYPILISEM